MRRTKRQLEAAILCAVTGDQKALAHYRLAVFHDNNSRETLAIPHYRRALSLGLSPTRTPKAHAWLASSLYKTGRPARALNHIQKALQLTRAVPLKRFLTALKQKIFRSMKSSPGTP